MMYQERNTRQGPNIYKTSYDEPTKMLQRNETYEKFTKKRGFQKTSYEKVTTKV